MLNRLFSFLIVLIISFGASLFVLEKFFLHEALAFAVTKINKNNSIKINFEEFSGGIFAGEYNFRNITVASDESENSNEKISLEIEQLFLKTSIYNVLTLSRVVEQLHIDGLRGNIKIRNLDKNEIAHIKEKNRERRKERREKRKQRREEARKERNKAREEHNKKDCNKLSCFNFIMKDISLNDIDLNLHFMNEDKGSRIYKNNNENVVNINIHTFKASEINSETLLQDFLFNTNLHMEVDRSILSIFNSDKEVIWDVNNFTNESVRKIFGKDNNILIDGDLNINVKSKKLDDDKLQMLWDISFYSFLPVFEKIPNNIMNKVFESTIGNLSKTPTDVVGKFQIGARKDDFKDLNTLKNSDVGASILEKILSLIAEKLTTKLIDKTDVLAPIKVLDNIMDEAIKVNS